MAIPFVAIASQVARSLGTRSIFSASKPAIDAVGVATDVNKLRSQIRTTVRREASDLRTGRRRGRIALEVDETARQALDYDKIVDRVIRGEKLQTAVRDELVPAISMRIRNGSVRGRQALEMADRLGELNRDMQRLRDPLGTAKRTMNQTLARYGLNHTGRTQTTDTGQTVDVYIDTEGHEITSEDVAEIAESEFYTVDPQFATDPERVADAMEVKIGNVLNQTSQLKRNFQKSLDSSNMATNSPRLYADLLTQANGMSASAFLAFLQTGEVDSAFTYLDSDRFSLVANANSLISAIGLDPNDYTYAERNW